ncbi:hypothetical protein ACJRO7_032007 [Eucalyptus globulus]|uniref:Uncharacterized protein n=1 Tax=Eucalyptus globulus TaxID=34317 RepID=A0ABD3JHY9_EUCGL
MKPSQTTNKELKDSKSAERSNATRPSQEPSKPSQNSGNLLKQAVPTMARLLSHVSAANSVSKDEEQYSTCPRPQVIEGIFFFSSPERELLAAKKIDEEELRLFGSLSRSVHCARRKLSQIRMFTCTMIVHFACQIAMMIALLWTGSAEKILGLTRRIKKR